MHYNRKIFKIEYEKIEEIYLQTLEIGPNSKIEYIIAQSGYFSCLYAINVLKSPFSLGEPEIVNSFSSINYAKNILKGRFKLLELNLTELSAYTKIIIFDYTKRIMELNHE